MSVVLIINYTWNADWDKEPQPTAADGNEAAEGAGLQWKIWLRDRETKRRGGVYLFADRASAEAWLELGKKYLDRPDTSDYDIRIFDINEPVSRVTRAPLDIPATTPSAAGAFR